MPKYKECVMTDDKPCTDCNMCDMCDLDPDKICDNCYKCIDNKDADYNGVEIDDILTEDNSIIMDELDIDDQKRQARDPMKYVTDDGHTLEADAYDSEYDDESDSDQDFEDEE